MVVSIVITKPEGGLKDGEPVMSMTFDVEGKITGTKKEMSRIANVELALIEEQPLTGDLPLRDEVTGEPREGRRTSFTPANPTKKGDWSSFSGSLHAPDINYRTIEVRATMDDGSVETTQKQIRHVICLHWSPPCGCDLYLGFDEVHGKPIHNMSDDPDVYKGILDEYEKPGTGGRLYHRTKHCRGHAGVKRHKIREVVHSETERVQKARWKFAELNPDAVEKIRTPQGEIEIFKDNIDPIVVEWEGKDENRFAKIRINPAFNLPSARSKSKVNAMKKHLASEVGEDKAVFLEE